MCRRNGGCNMRLGIDRRGTSGLVQLAFDRGLHDWRVASREINRDGSRKSLEERASPRLIAGKALIRRHDRSSHEPVSGGNRVDQATSDAEADHTSRAEAHFAFDRWSESTSVPAAGNGTDARAA